LSLWLQPPTLKVGEEKLEYAVKGPLFAASAVLRVSSQASCATIQGELQASIPLRKKWQRTISSAFEYGSPFGFQTYHEKDPASGQENYWHLGAPGLRLNDQLFLDPAGLSAFEAPVLAAPQLIHALAARRTAKNYTSYFVAGHRLYAIHFESIGESKDLNAKLTDAMNPNWAKASEFQIFWGSGDEVPSAFRVRATPIGGSLEARLIQHDRV
jgi:hypothetical protein